MVRDSFFRLARPFVRRFTDKRRTKKMKQVANKLIPNFKFSNDGITIDLGANRGDFTVLAAKESRLVYAFEPNPIAFNYLQRRVSKMSNVLTLQLAASNKTELISFYNHPDSAGDPLGFSIRSSIFQKESNFQELNRKVVAINFADLIVDMRRIDCLKVDIEGAESLIWPIIMANKSKINYLLMEVHDKLNPNLRNEIVNFVDKNGLAQRWTTSWL